MVLRAVASNVVVAKSGGGRGKAPRRGANLLKVEWPPIPRVQCVRLADSGWKCKQWTEPMDGGIPSVGEFVGLPDVWPLLPLPMPALVKWKKHKSCRLRQRLKRRLQVFRAAVSVVNLINALHTGSCFDQADSA